MAGNHAIQQAVTLHRQGRLGEAEQLYIAILRAEPAHFDALHLLGVLMHQRGQSLQALDLIARAIAANDRSADAHANLGRVLAALKQPEDALASFGKALALKPDHVEALFHRGNVLFSLKRLEEALASYDRAVAAAPGYAQAHINRGVALRALQRPGEALASHDRALAINPNAAEAHSNRGNALLDIKRPQEAVAAFDRALELNPSNAETFYNRGNALIELKRYDEALESYDRALALAPNHLNALVNRGTALRELRRPAEAVEGYDRVLALDPMQAEVLNNRGNALCDLNRHAAALESYDAALRLRPGYIEALLNRGNALMDIRRVDEALASYDAALALEPENPDAHWNRGLVHLALGDFDRGWRGYEWRSRRKTDNDVREFAKPRWTGTEPLEGKTILLHAEQGFGDAIQFIRYAPLVAAKGARVIVEAPASLKKLIADVEGVLAVFSRGEVLPDFDLQCPLLSTPLAFRTTLDGIPAAVPYLRATADRIEKWRSRLLEKSFRIGIAWTGNPTNKNDHNRSVALAKLAPLASDPRVQLVGIQRDVRNEDARTLREHPEILSLGAELADFSDTAAVIELLDLVISIDTSVVHLAGALGRPVWVMLSYNGDWRWMLEGERSPWYPTARLFRQPSIGDWDSVFAQVSAALSLKLSR